MAWDFLIDRKKAQQLNVLKDLPAESDDEGSGGQNWQPAVAGDCAPSRSDTPEDSADIEGNAVEFHEGDDAGTIEPAPRALEGGEGAVIPSGRDESDAAVELSRQIEAAARTHAAGDGAESGDVVVAAVGGGGKARASGKLQPASHVLRLARAGMVARGFENAAQVFVYLETGSSSGDVISGVEIERGLKSLKLDGQVDSASFLAALGAKSKGKSDVFVSYREFMRHMAVAVGGQGWESGSSGGNEGRNSVVLLEEARKRWKRTAERVRRHVQVSKEAEEQRARMREQEEARSDLFALRKQLGLGYL